MANYKNKKGAPGKKYTTYGDRIKVTYTDGSTRVVRPTDASYGATKKAMESDIAGRNPLGIGNKKSKTTAVNAIGNGVKNGQGLVSSAAVEKKAKQATQKRLTQQVMNSNNDIRPQLKKAGSAGASSLEQARMVNGAVAAALPKALPKTFSGNAIKSGAEQGVLNLKQGTKQGLLALMDSVAPMAEPAGKNSRYLTISPNALGQKKRDAQLEQKRRNLARETVQKQQAIANKYGSLNMGEQIVHDVIANAIPMVPSMAGGALGGGAAAAAGMTAKGVKLAQTVGAMAPMFNYSRGMGEGQALNEGATMDEANLFGLARAIVETGSEMMIAGYGKLMPGMLQPSQFTSKIASPVLKKSADMTLRALGEGAEEVVAEAADPYLQRAIYNPNAQNATLGQLGYAGLLGALTSGVINAGAAGVNMLPRASANAANSLRNPQGDHAADTALHGAPMSERIAQQERLRAANTPVGAETAPQTEQITAQNAQNAQNGAGMEIIQNAINNTIQSNQGQQTENHAADNLEQPVQNGNIITRRTPTEQEMQWITPEYQNAVDGGLLQFVQAVRNKAANAISYRMNGVQPQEAEDIRALTGIDVSGYKRMIDRNAVIHIGKRHGKNGAADTSLSDDADIARMQYVINHYDTMELSNEKNYAFKSRNNQPSSAIVYSKRVNGSYYVIEAVPDSKSKVLHIVTAYKTKKAPEYVTDADVNTSPRPDAQNEHTYDGALSDNSVTQSGIGVNGQPSLQQETMRSNGEGVQEFVDYEISRISPDARQWLERVGSVSGMNVRVMDGLPHVANGMFDSHGDILLDGNMVNSAESMRKVLGHEAYHAMRNTDEHKRLQDFAWEWYQLEHPDATQQDMLNEKIAQYAESDVTLDNDAAWDEVGAEFAERLMTDEAMARRVIAEKPSLAQRIWQTIQNILQRFTGKLSTLEKQQRDILLRAEKFYREGLQSMQYAGVAQDGQRYSIQDPNQKNLPAFVRADRDVTKLFSGADSKQWGRNVEQYINDRIRHGEDLYLQADNGDILAITENTAGKAKFRNTISIGRGRVREMSDEEYRLKLEMECHIDELAVISKPDDWDTDRGNKHAKRGMAQEGWEYRKAYYEAADGRNYEVTLSISKNGEIGDFAVNEVYNVGRFQQRKNTASSRGSSTREGGARAVKIPNGTYGSANGVSVYKGSIAENDSFGNGLFDNLTEEQWRKLRGDDNEGEVRHSLSTNERYFSQSDKDITPKLQVPRSARSNGEGVQEFVDYDISRMSPDARQWLERVGSVSGMNVRVVDGLPHAANGMFDSHGDILLDGNRVNSAESMRKILGHEIYHAMRNTDEHKRLQDFAWEWYQLEHPDATQQDMLNEKIAQYAESDVTLDNDAAWDEVGAEFAERLMTDEAMARRVIAEKPSLAQRIWQTIQNILQRFTGKLSTLEKQQRDILLRAEKFYREGLQSMQYAGVAQDGQRYSIQDPNQKNLPAFVRADRDVTKLFSGADSKQWGRNVEQYINDRIRHGEDLYLQADNGDILAITENTAGKAKFRNTISIGRGRVREMSDEEYRLKLEMECHIDELAVISKPDDWDTDRGNKHAKRGMAQEGWEYRKAYYEAADGRNYEVTLSISKNGEIGDFAVNEVYNVGRFQQRKNTASSRGSSTREGGARAVKIPNGTYGSANGVSVYKGSIAENDSFGNGLFDNLTEEQWRKLRGDDNEGEVRHSLSTNERYFSQSDKDITPKLQVPRSARSNGEGVQEPEQLIGWKNVQLTDLSTINRDVLEFYDKATKNSKLDIAIVDGLPDTVNGCFHNGRIYVNSKKATDAETVRMIFSHELFHGMTKTEGYDSMINTALDWYKSIYRGEGLEVTREDLIEMVRQDYAATTNGQIQLSDDDAVAELGAQFMERAITDDAFIDKLVSEQPHIAQRIWQALKEWLSGFGKRKGDTATALELEQMALVKRAQKLYEKSFRQLQRTGMEDTVYAGEGWASYSLDVGGNDRNTVVSKLEANKDTINKHGIVSRVYGRFAGEKDAKQIRKEAKTMFDEMNNGVYRKGFGRVTLNKKGVKDSLSHGTGELKNIAFEAIPDVIRDGVEIDFQPDWKRRGYDTHIFAGVVLIDNVPLQMGVVVRSGDDYHKYYVHEVYVENQKK